MYYFKMVLQLVYQLSLIVLELDNDIIFTFICQYMYNIIWFAIIWIYCITSEIWHFGVNYLLIFWGHLFSCSLSFSSVSW